MYVGKLRSPGTRMTIQHAIDKGVVGSAAVSGASAAVSWISQASEYVSLIAGLLAILSAGVAMAYTIWKWRREAKRRK